MKTAHILFSSLFVSGVLSRPLSALNKRDVDPNLVPELGLQAGLNPTGTGDCDGIPGANGVPIKIPCQCPPDRDDFIKALNANVAAGFAVHNPTVKVTFPTDNSTQSQQARITAAAITLQNLNGPGQGCPIASTTLTAQSNAINAAAAKASASPSPPPPPAAPSSPPPSTSSSPAASSVQPAQTSTAAVQSSTGTSNVPNTPPPAAGNSCPAAVASPSAPSPSQTQSVNLSNSGNGNTNSLPSTNVTLDPALVPDLGAVAGVNPTGTGDCDGVVKQANGQPIKVPCSCPPDQDSFIASLSANVAAGHAVNNPSVAVSFPLGNSSHDQFDRIEAAIVTLQNLHGPGQGCPVASTTLGQQQAAVLNEMNNSR